MQDNRIKQAPFYVGQKVVALQSAKNSHGDGVTKNSIYTVLGVCMCACGKWKVDVGVRHNTNSVLVCSLCNAKLPGSFVVFAGASLFAPYDPPAIEIPEDILKEPVEERLDVVKVEEVV